jgi:hypothetical protein
VRVAGVQDEGLAVLEVVDQQLRQPCVPALRHERGLVDGLALLRVVVDVEVFGLQHLEIELPVLDLVLSEVLRLDGGGRGEERGGAQGEQYGEAAGH